MKILGIDTSTKFLCLGIYDGTKIYEYTLEVGRALSSLLGVTIKRVLDSLGWEAKSIDYFACGLGPGSFTGMRTGVSFVKGLSWAVKKPVIGISTLDILALNAGDTDKQIIPIIDAKRSLIYCSVYAKSGLVRTRPYMLLNEEELFRQIKKNCLIMGDALSLYKEKILTNTKGAILLDKDCWYPKPHNIIKAALGRIKDKKLNTSFDIKPIYLYPKECQIKVSAQASPKGTRSHE
jgi:tRNA threonylcarbamoyladenosine biosynthesis protein TsaB